jgi:hypothetical protein
VSLHAVPLEGTLRTRFVSQLGAALALRGIDVCDDDRVVAVVEIETRGDEIRIVATDAVMDKRVERTIDVAAMPTDGLPLMLALATDELLRAAWSELLLPDARPKQPVPPELRRAVNGSAASAESRRQVAPMAVLERPLRIELGAQAAAEVFGGGHEQIGGDVGMTYWIHPRVGVHGSAGARLGIPVSAPKGEVQSTATPIAIGARVALTDPARSFGVDLGARTQLVPVHFVAEAVAPVRGRERSAVAFAAGAALRGTYALSSRVLSWVELHGGVTLRSVEARDEASPVTGLSGGMVGVTMGLASKL